MHVVSVQIGSVRTLDLESRTIETGIHKTPVGTVAVDPEGIANDAVVNTKHHGGPDQAVYVYSAADYSWWEEQLGRSLAPGTFGENLTVSDTPTVIRTGDRLAIGEVLLEVTAPRIPCSTFAARMGEQNWIRRFRDAGRPGFYCRVLAPGVVQPGNEVAWIPAPGDFISINEMVEDAYSSDPSPARIKKALASPIAARARAAYQPGPGT
jgi:MOSC domain-containing protein YiiM